MPWARTLPSWARTAYPTFRVPGSTARIDASVTELARGRRRSGVGTGLERRVRVDVGAREGGHHERPVSRGQHLLHLVGARERPAHGRRSDEERRHLLLGGEHLGDVLLQTVRRRARYWRSRPAAIPIVGDRVARPHLERIGVEVEREVDVIADEQVAIGDRDDEHVVVGDVGLAARAD